MPAVRYNSGTGSRVAGEESRGAPTGFRLLVGLSGTVVKAIRPSYGKPLQPGAHANPCRLPKKESALTQGRTLDADLLDHAEIAALMHACSPGLRNRRNPREPLIQHHLARLCVYVCSALLGSRCPM